MACSESQRTSDTTKLSKCDVIEEFRAHYFAAARLASFRWTFLEKELESSKSLEFVSDILKQTCRHSLSRKFPVSVRYRTLFLSELIKRQEAVTCEPLDELYDTLAEVVGLEETADGFKSYFLPCGDTVSLLENTALISEGTTGLVTWEAALYLAEWALDNQQAFTSRSVLELGSGAGLTGISICRSCSPARYIFSDCHSGVLQRLRYNVQVNGLLERTPPAVSVEELDWMAATEEQLREMGADTVIAADVVYDPDIARCLVTLLSKILRCLSADIFICSTIRNPDTYSSFKQQLGNAGISHHEITGAVNHVFPYVRVSTIEIIRLSIRDEAR